jgi:Arc/MetJ family transcription regulator
MTFFLTSLNYGGQNILLSGIANVMSCMSSRPKKRITICLTDYVLYEVDRRRGLIPRSAYINDLLEQALGLKHDKALAR